MKPSSPASTPVAPTPGRLPADDVRELAAEMADLAQHLFGLLLPAPADAYAAPSPVATPATPEVPPAVVPAGPVPMPVAVPVPAALPVPDAVPVPPLQVPPVQAASAPPPGLPHALPVPDLPSVVGTSPAPSRITRNISLLDEISFLDD